MTKKQQPLVGDIREVLKMAMNKELEQLPDLLNELEPAQRLNIICKLIPYVLPKVQAVHSEYGEPQNEVLSGFQW